MISITLMCHNRIRPKTKFWKTRNVRWSYDMGFWRRYWIVDAKYLDSGSFQASNLNYWKHFFLHNIYRFFIKQMGKMYKFNSRIWGYWQYPGYWQFPGTQFELLKILFLNSIVMVFIKQMRKIYKFNSKIWGYRHNPGYCQFPGT